MGSTLGKIWKATNSGTSSNTDPGGWNDDAVTTDTRIFDDGVTWQYVATPTLEATTRYLIDGINWILKPCTGAADTLCNRNALTQAVVTLSIYRRAAVSGVAGSGDTLETAIAALIQSNITVIASANNQNGDACHTSPARLSAGNLDTSLRKGVITVGGSMLVNRPWALDITDVPSGIEADGQRDDNEGYFGVEPAYNSTEQVREARWICGKGDSSADCYNDTFKDTPNPGDGSVAISTYHRFHGGSNAGPCVTLFAPAKNIFLASLAGQDAYRDARLRAESASGTSFSAPIAAGIAARILQANPAHTPAQVRQVLEEQSVAMPDPEDTLNTYQYCSPKPCTPTVRTTGTPNRFLRYSDVRITTGPTVSASSSGVTLSVVASGQGLSYSWYKVNDQFDVTATSGAYSSTLLASSTTHTTNTPGRFWVRVTGSCGSADSDIVKIAALPPTTFTATAKDTTTIRLAWIPASDATSSTVYVIRFRTSLSGTWTLLTDSHTASAYEHTGLPRGTLYQYQVLAKLSSGETSAPVADYGMTRPFSDNLSDTASARVRVRGIHIAELRRPSMPGAPLFLDSPMSSPTRTPPAGLKRQTLVTSSMRSMRLGRN